MKTMMFTDGTSVTRLQQFFVDTLARLQADNWQWETRTDNHSGARRFVIRAFNSAHSHIVIADDVETMLQTLINSIAATPVASLTR